MHWKIVVAVLSGVVIGAAGYGIIGTVRRNSAPITVQELRKDAIALNGQTVHVRGVMVDYYGADGGTGGAVLANSVDTYDWRDIHSAYDVIILPRPVELRDHQTVEVTGVYDAEANIIHVSAATVTKAP